MLKFIVINSENRTISVIESESDHLKTMQKAVGGYIETAYRPDDQNDIFVDEEGLLKGYNTFFTYEGAHQPFAGNGIITGATEDGDTASTSLSLEEVTQKVKFYTIQEIRRMM